MADEPFLKINNAAIERIAKSAEAQQIVTDAANKIAAAARDNVLAAGGDRDTVKVTEYKTDRSVAGVSVPAHHQAADGALSRASETVGIHITT